MTISKTGFAAALAASAMMGGFADAATMTQTVSGVSLSNSGTSSNGFNITAFDAGLGTLTSVSIDATGLSFEVYTDITNLGGEGGTSQTSASFQLSAPGSLVIQSGLITAEAVTDSSGNFASKTETGALGSQNTSSGLGGYLVATPSVTVAINNYGLSTIVCDAGPCDVAGHAYLTGAFAVTYTYTPAPTGVPEPASALVLGGGLLGLFGLRRRRDPAGARRISTE
jgi:hypothetical protein